MKRCALSIDMEATLVLRAASCWGAWATAMAILKNLNIEDATAAEWLEKAYWLITRVPEPLYRELTKNIIDHGLCGGTVRLWASDWHWRQPGDASLAATE